MGVLGQTLKFTLSVIFRVLQRREQTLKFNTNLAYQGAYR